MKNDSVLFLEENFKKLLDYHMAFSAMEDELKAWLGQTLETFASQQTSGMILSDQAKTNTRRETNLISCRTYRAEVAVTKDKVFDKFAMSVCYSAEYEFDGHSGYFPTVWIRPRKDAVSKVLKAFENDMLKIKNLDVDGLTKRFGETGVGVFQMGDHGITLAQKDDEANKKPPYRLASTLDELQGDINALGNELLRLAKKFSVGTGV